MQYNYLINNHAKFNCKLFQSLLVLVALAACVVSQDQSQDQETAEQYFRIHGVYPSWYQYGATAFNGVRSYPYTAGYPYTYGAYPAATYAGVKSFYGGYPVVAPASTYPAYSTGFGYAY